MQAKRKAYQEVNHSLNTGSSVTTAETAQTQPEKSVKKVVAVKATNKSQNPKVSESEVETVSAENTEPAAIGTVAS